VIPPVELLLGGAALAAAAVARAGVAASARRSPVAARLRTLYSLLAALFALRLAASAWASPLPAILLMLVAAWLPLAGLRLVEELRRRHAPRPVKLAALGGALAFSLVAATAGLVWSGPAIIALAAYQLAGMAAMIALLGRGRGDLAPAERRTADTFLLALLIAAPLALTDFHALWPDAPVRGGPFALLVLVLATSRLASAEGSPGRLLGDVALLLASGGFAALAAAAAVPGVARDAGPAVAAAGAAVAALALVADRAAGSAAGGAGLLAALARAPGEGVALLASHPILATGRVLGPKELAAYPEAALEPLGRHRVIGADIEDAEAREAAGEILAATAATHLLRLSRRPLSLLAIAAGGLAGRALDDELEIVARLVEKDL